MNSVEDDFEPTSPEDAKPFIESEDKHTRQQSASASSGSDEETRSPARSWSISTVAVVGSLVALAICAAASFRSYSPTAPEPLRAASPPPAPAPISARMLFVSPEHADVVTDNFIEMSQGALDDSDRPALRRQVAKGLSNASETFRIQYPEVSRSLELLQLNAVQQAAVLKSIRAEGDPRVLKMGRDIAGVVQSSFSLSRDQEHLKQSLADYALEQAPLARQLRDEICPPEMPELCESDDDEDMELSFDDDNLHMSQSLHHDWDLQVDVSQPQVSDSVVQLPVPRRLKSGKGGGSSGFSMMDGLKLMEFASKYAKKFKKMAKKFGISMPEIKKAIKKVNVQQLMTCVLENAAKADPTSMVKCGAQFASAAMSVMKSLVSGGGSSSSGSGGKGGGSRRRKSMFSGFP